MSYTLKDFIEDYCTEIVFIGSPAVVNVFISQHLRNVSLLNISSHIVSYTKRFLPPSVSCYKTFPATKRFSCYKTFPATKRFLLQNTSCLQTFPATKRFVRKQSVRKSCGRKHLVRKHSVRKRSVSQRFTYGYPANLKIVPRKFRIFSRYISFAGNPCVLLYFLVKSLNMPWKNIFKGENNSI